MSRYPRPGNLARFLDGNILSRLVKLGLLTRVPQVEPMWVRWHVSPARPSSMSSHAPRAVRACPAHPDVPPASRPKASDIVFHHTVMAAVLWYASTTRRCATSMSKIGWMVLLTALLFANVVAAQPGQVTPTIGPASPTTIGPYSPP